MINNKPTRLIIVFVGWMCLLVPVLLSGCKEKKKCEVTVLDWPEEIENCITDAEKKGIKDGTKNPGDVFARMKDDCPDVEKYDNGYLLFSLKHNPNAILVSSKKDMMAQLKEHAKKEKCCIQKLKIKAHGDDGNISVGAGKTNEESKYINGDPSNEDVYNKDDWQKELKDLKALFCKDAEIELNGCDVGSGDVGRYKMEEIAKFFGTDVEAPKGKVKGGTEIDDLPDSQKRKVKPPKGEIRPPGDSAKDESNKKKKTRKKQKEKMGAKPFRGNVVAMGIYPSHTDSIPRLAGRPTLPITDEVYIQNFLNGIIAEPAYGAAEEGYKVTTTILLQYEDQSFDVAHTVYDHAFFANEVEGEDLFFELIEGGDEIIEAGLRMTGF